jgi:oxygen-independent coproporphyrinogen-3 oxidase
MPLYLEALSAEIRAANYPSAPDTLYLGGGTPSLIEVPQLQRLLSSLTVTRWHEATIEAAPGTISQEKAHGWADLGINRVSLGVQSFVPKVAAAAGRKHTPESVADDIETLRQAGIPDINIDILAGLAHQTEHTWRTSLDWTIRLDPAHVSVYMLDVDDESNLGRELQAGGSRFGAASAPSEDRIADFYLHAIHELENNSLSQYEISNFARPGRESRHNLKYWRMQPYIGFGVDAHSFDGSRRWGNVSSVAEYLDRSRHGESVRASIETLDERRLAEDRFITGLRQISGFDPSPRDVRLFQEPLRRMLDRGWLRNESGRLALTKSGLMFSNELFAEFLSP